MKANPFLTANSAVARMPEIIAGRGYVRIEHTLTVLGVANAIIHQIPIHTVRACIAGVATIARLPLLKTIGGIVEVLFAV